MTIPAFLNGGVLHESGMFYLLIDRDDVEDDESVFAAGRREGDEIVISELSEVHEIVSMESLAGSWTNRAEVAVMTAEGDLLFSDGTKADIEIIPGAGYNSLESKGVGRMTALRQVGDALYAMGFGGQVYRCLPDGLWESIGPKTGNPSSVFFTIAKGPSHGLIFGGSNIWNFESSKEIDTANEAGDADALAELILAAVRPNMMTIHTYDGQWSDLGIEFQGSAVTILPKNDVMWYLFSDSGVVWETPDFLAFNEIWAPERPAGFTDIKYWKGFPLLLSGNDLYLLRDGDFESFAEPLPVVDDICLSIWTAEERIAAVFRSFVMLYENGNWSRLMPVYR